METRAGKCIMNGYGWNGVGMMSYPINAGSRKEDTEEILDVVNYHVEHG